MTNTRPTIVLVAAILAAAGLEAIALWKGIDGKFFGTTMVLIGGLGGVTVGRLIYYRPVEPSVTNEGEDAGE